MWWCWVLMLPLLLSTPSVTTLQTAAGLTDVDAQLLAIIPIISTRISGSPASTSILESSCVTPEGHQGVCGRLSECPTYAHLVKDIQDKNVVQFFLNRVCRALPNAIHICCPQIGTLDQPGTHTRVDATPPKSNDTTTPQPNARRPILGAGPPRTGDSRPQSSTTQRRPSPADTRLQLGSPQPSQPGATRPSQPGASRPSQSGASRPSLQRPNDRQPIVDSDSESSVQEVPVGGVSSLDQQPPLPPLPAPAPALPPQLQPQPTPLPLPRPQQPPQLQPQQPPIPAQPQPTLPQEDSQQTEQNPTQPGQQQPQPQIPPQPPSDTLTADMKCGLLPPGFVEGDPWPWTVEVMGGGGGCGGTLITSAHILAPAHCLSNPQRVEVVVGGRVLPVRPLFHPEYDPFTQSNDLALLTLSSPLTQGQHGGEFMPACLPFRYNFDGFRYQTLTRIPPPASQNRKDRVEVEEVEVVGLHDCGPPDSSTFSSSSTFPNRVEVQQRKHMCGASTLSTSSLCDAGGSSLVFHDDYDTGFYYVVGVGSITNSCTPQRSGFLSPGPVQSSPTFPGRPQSVPEITNESRPSLIITGISVQQKPSQAIPGDQIKPPSSQPSAALYTRVGAYLDWIVEQVNGL